MHLNGSGTVNSINCSSNKGTKKLPVQEAVLIENYGIKGDSHAGHDIRQVSLLPIEDVKKINEIRKNNKDRILGPGDHAENITTAGIALTELNIKDVLKIGETAKVEISMIGKECHNSCDIYKALGECIMSNEGVFAKVLQSGPVKVGDRIEVIK